MSRAKEGLRYRASQDGHRQLWCSVLLQALADAGSNAATLIERDEARRWLTEPVNEWRETVCDFAGMNEECVVTQARRMYP